MRVLNSPAQVTVLTIFNIFNRRNNKCVIQYYVDDHFASLVVHLPNNCPHK